MPTFRPYTNDELRSAAEAYGIDPAFVEAVYAVESSRGTNPKAMRANPVKRKRDTTIVRGPFQLEDDTTADVIRKHKLGNVNVDDPDVHLDLALRLMQDLKQRYAGDYTKMAMAYLGGHGGVKNAMAKDELGTTTGAYSNKILAEMRAIRGDGDMMVASASPQYPTADQMDALLMPEPAGASPFQFGAEAEPDMFGMAPTMVAGGSGMLGEGATWADMAGMGGGDNVFALPTSGGMASITDESEVGRWVEMLADEELQGKEYASAG